MSWIIWRCGWEESVSWGFFWLKLEGKKKGGEGNFILRQLGNMSCAAAAARQPAALGFRWQKHLAARQHEK